MTAVDTDPGTRCVSTTRALRMDAIHRANSGHPGTPMHIAPVDYTFWQWQFRFDSNDLVWPHRDRFLLAGGRASTLSWSSPHLCGVRALDPGYQVPGTPAASLDDLKSARQPGSKCPVIPGTAGRAAPWQPPARFAGVATPVGMAIAGG